MPMLGMAQETGSCFAGSRPRENGRQGRAADRGRDRQGDGRDRGAGGRHALRRQRGRGRGGSGRDGIAFILADGRVARRAGRRRRPRRGRRPRAARRALASPEARRLGADARRVERVLASPKAAAPEQGADRRSGLRVRAGRRRRRGGQIARAPTAAPCRPGAGEELAVSSAWRDGRAHAALVAGRAALLPPARRRRVAARELVARRGAGPPGYERVTHTDLLVKVCAEALRRHPRVNASWRDGLSSPGRRSTSGSRSRPRTPWSSRSSTTPTRSACAEIAERRARSSRRARGRLRPDDVAGRDIHDLEPRHVRRRRVPGDRQRAAGGDPRRRPHRRAGRGVEGEPAVRPMLTLTLSFDHRAVDGARAPGSSTRSPT